METLHLVGLIFVQTLLCYCATTPATAGNTIKRRMDDYLEYCPFTSTCNTSAPKWNESINGTTLDWMSTPCCKDCECHNECGLNCCPDKSVYFESKEEIYDAKEINRCVDAQYRPFDEQIKNGQSFEMVSKCPYQYSDIEIATKCTREYHNLQFDVPLRNILPAYDNHTDSIYKNIFCAECNNVELKRLEFTGLNFSCLTKMRKITYIRDLATAAETKQEDDCNILFEPLHTFSQLDHWNSKECDRTFISGCNVTGLWRTYDRYLEEACLSYKSVYKHFRNVHCFLCNGFNASEITKLCLDYPTLSNPRSDDFDFITVLDWSKDTKSGEMKDEDIQCLQNDIFNKSKADDWSLHCPDGTMLQNGTCLIPLQVMQSYAIMEVNLVLEPMDVSDEESIYTLSQILSIVINETDEKIALLISQNVLLYTVAGFVTFKNDMNLYQTNGTFYIQSVQYVAVKIQILVKRFKQDFFQTQLDFALVFSNMSSFSYFIAKFHHFNRNFLTDGWLLHPDNCTTGPERSSFVLCVNSSYHNKKELQFTFSSSDTSTLKDVPFIIVSVEPEPFCPRISLLKERPCKLSEITEKIYSKAFVHTLLSENETHMFFCYQDYFKHLDSLKLEIANGTKEMLPLETGLTVIYFLSVVCLSASLLSLVFTLIVYCVFPVLRTLPGLNNMALVISLICFQTMTLVNTVTTIKISWLCAFAGMFTHFNLNLSFAWMFVCTFHMLTVFVKIRNRSVGRNNFRAFVSYFAFTIVVATLIVSITTTIAMVQSGGKDIGYGGVTCYINNPVMIIFVVAVPVAVVTILNIVMFGIVVLKVKQLPTLASSNPQERNYIAIFVKLSTITGMTWIFGFIFVFSHLDVFAYVFVVLNAGQGVFIMLSFVCNRRVLNLVFKKQRMTRTETTRTTSTQLSIL